MIKIVSFKFCFKIVKWCQASLISYGSSFQFLIIVYCSVFLWFTCSTFQSSSLDLRFISDGNRKYMKSSRYCGDKQCRILNTNRHVLYIIRNLMSNIKPFSNTVIYGLFFLNCTQILQHYVTLLWESSISEQRYY